MASSPRRRSIRAAPASFDFTTTSTTVENADGSSTVTQTENAANGSLINETVTTTSANGLSITTQSDNTGSGTFDTTVTDNTVDNADGSVTETITQTSANGTLEGKQIVNYQRRPLDGDHHHREWRRPDGAGEHRGHRAHWRDDRYARELQRRTARCVNETVTTTSANGLSVTTQTDSTGNGTFDTTATDNTVINANGSRTETVTTTKRERHANRPDGHDG